MLYEVITLEPPSSCTIIVNPRDGKFATEFEICVEQAFKNLQPEDVDGPIYFDPRTMYNKPWLMVPVITSYSIHYTKLYDGAGIYEDPIP